MEKPILLSMTGFSSLDIDLIGDKGEQLILHLELKTLNGRFFETTCKLPSGLGYLEHRIISILKKKLIRGRVFLSVRVGSQGISLERVIPSFDIAQGYMRAAQELKKKFALEGELQLSDFLTLPHLFVFEKEHISNKQEHDFLQKLDEAIDAVTASREREGTELREDLEMRFFKCAERIQEINALVADEIRKKKGSIQDVLVLVSEGEDSAKVRLDELYRTLDKIDIHEEVTRFQSHLKAVGSVFEDDVDMSKGRRLDFILQELTRETNTVAAKCSTYEISALAVDIKVELEKIREQIQNVV